VQHPQAPQLVVFVISYNIYVMSFCCCFVAAQKEFFEQQLT
jgi:hypothetical protein